MRRTKQVAGHNITLTPLNFSIGTMDFVEKDYEKRYGEYMKKPISPFFMLNLEALKLFGLDRAGDELVSAP